MLITRAEIRVCQKAADVSVCSSPRMHEWFLSGRFGVGSFALLLLKIAFWLG